MTDPTLRLLPALAMLLATAACDGLPFGGDGTDGDRASLAATLDPANSQDVEAPEVFDLTEPGLWDGRPSLGGVWVAHPSVVDPERVIIRNTETGRSVIGALFRKERETPGPALQVSSDAAEELGMLAGAPATLSVIALRREALPDGEATPAAAEAETVATALPDPAPVTETALEAAATPAPAPAPAPPPLPAGAPDKPFVQIGIFSVPENAQAAADALRSDGLSARVLEQESQGKSFTRVIVGPAPTEADRSAILTKVKALGYADAYPVTN